MKRDTQPTDALDLATEPCDDCAPTTRWERRDLSPTGEAWLGTCETCGSMQVQALDAPEMEIEDPLAFFLLGVPKSEPAPTRPPWQRFYARTLDAPFHLRWRFVVDPCEECEATSSVSATDVTASGTHSLTLCLNCGVACVETTRNAMAAAPIRLTGNQWSPPDLAVKKLRDSIFEPYRKWAATQDWNRRTTEDD